MRRGRTRQLRGVIAIAQAPVPCGSDSDVLRTLWGDPDHQHDEGTISF